MAGTITIGGEANGLLSGAKTIGPLTITGSAVVGEVLDVTLSAGNNTIAVPSTATACVIVPPSAGTVTLQLDGDYISPKWPFVKTFDPAHMPATFTLNAASGVTVEITFI
jgi:hypothetical protein